MCLHHSARWNASDLYLPPEALPGSVAIREAERDASTGRLSWPEPGPPQGPEGGRVREYENCSASCASLLTHPMLCNYPSTVACQRSPWWPLHHAAPVGAQSRLRIVGIGQCVARLCAEPPVVGPQRRPPTAQPSPHMSFRGRDWVSRTGNHTSP